MIARTKKLRIFILSNDDLTSNLIFSPLLEDPAIEVLGVAYDKKITSQGCNKMIGAWLLLKRIALPYWIYLVFTNLIFSLFEIKMLYFSANKRQQNPLKSVRYLCRQKKIPCWWESNFNSSQFKQRLSQLKPDLLLIRINQLLDQDLLAIPAYETWCIHSSILPAYKGIAAEFHALNNAASQIGSTIFIVNEKLDQGKIFSQQTVVVDNEKSVFFHMLQNNLQAGKLLSQCVTELNTTQQVIPRLVTSIPEANYYSWPNQQQWRSFHAKNKKLISLREALCLLAWSIY